jgi:hypothetical protein
MTSDTRRRVTLGQLLTRTEETDSSIAAGIYVPRFNGNNDANDVALDSNLDIQQDYKEVLSEYVFEHQKGYNANHPGDFYALKQNPRPGSNSADSSLQRALMKIDSKTFKNEAAPPIELGVGTSLNSGFNFDQESIRSFRQGLIEDVLSEKNLFFSTEDGTGGFYNPTVSDENSAFPQGMFGAIKSNVPADETYGRFNKNNRVGISKSDLNKAASLLLERSQNDYLTAQPLPRVNLNELRMVRLLSEGRQAVRDLKLDANGNIYKTFKEPLNTSNGVSNKPPRTNEEGVAAEDLADIFTVSEFNSFFQYGMTGVASKAAAYSLPTSLLLGTTILLPLLTLPNEVQKSKLLSNLASALPPNYIKLKNELGLKSGEDDDLDLSASLESFGVIWRRIFDGWKIFFGFFDEQEGLLNSIGSFINNLIPERIVQSPTFYFNFSRKILRELQGETVEITGDSAIKLLAKVYKDPSSSANLRFAAVLYKMGTRASKSKFRRTPKELAFFENKRVNRHRLFKNSSNNPVLLKHFDYLMLKKNGIDSTYRPDKFNDFTQIEENVDGIHRIPIETVRIVEDKIDADYVPFSIQDLRTNEIISLPAFIDSVTDNFNVNYESNHGYGRTDPIYTYSKTERDVQISFHLVSFSSSDHDRVYEIVNQLTSMCYPQRSRGQIRADSNLRKFYQPFSQIQTASPMVRVRLGNMIRSNRSSRGMKYLFGNLLGEDFNEGVLGELRIKKASLEAEIQILEAEKLRLEEFKEKFFQTRESNPDQEIIQLSANIPVPPLLTPKIGPIPVRNTRNIALFVNELKIQKETSVVKLNQESQFLIEFQNAICKIIKESNRQVFKNLIKGNDLTDDQFDEKFEFFVPLPRGMENLEFDETFLYDIYNKIDSLKEELEKIEQKLSDPSKLTRADVGGNNEYAPGTNFLSSQNNPIVRSFESSEGKGLACFIKSLGLDYNNVPWNTEDLNKITKQNNNAFFPTKTNIAPMRIKVSMSLAPIHDMPLGLSYDGTIMAPSHPVGKWSLPNS